MEEDSPKKAKREELFQLTFVRNIGKRQERTVLAKQMTHADATALRDAYAAIGERKIDALRAELQQAELNADNVGIQKKKAAIAAVIGKSETSTFSVALDRASNDAFLKPVRPEFPREEAARPADSEPVAPEAAKSKRGKSAESEPVAE